MSGRRVEYDVHTFGRVGCLLESPLGSVVVPPAVNEVPQYIVNNGDVATLTVHFGPLENRIGAG